MSFWDDRYASEEYVFGEAPNAFLARQKHRLAGYGNALAIADGEGRNGVWLAEQGLQVLSIDASPVGLAKADRLAQRRGVPLTTRCIDIAAYEWPEAAFDVAAAIFFQFAPPPLRDAIFAGLIRTLRPGGLLLLEGYTPKRMEYKTGGPGIVEQLYTEDLLREKFAPLEIIELAAYEAVLEEGRQHSGMAAVIDLVARKPV